MYIFEGDYIGIDLSVSPYWLFGLCLKSKVWLCCWFEVLVGGNPRKGGCQEQHAFAAPDVGERKVDVGGVEVEEDVARNDEVCLGKCCCEKTGMLERHDAAAVEPRVLCDNVAIDVVADVGAHAESG